MRAEDEEWILPLNEDEEVPPISQTGERESTAPLADEVLTVSEVNRLARFALEGITVTVQGEISRLATGYRYYVYFDLRDTESTLPAILTQNQLNDLDFKLEEGMSVVVHGTLTLYERQGKYQIRIDWLRPFGEGDIQRRIELLKKKLHAEGLFDDSRKKPLPIYPQKIGVVTSPRGAAVRDVIVTLSRRFPPVDVYIKGVTVQGIGAIEEITDALRFFDERFPVDVVILARGGGSLQDLEPFNSEAVARTIAAMRIPVITGIGHEPDVTIADLVADRRASTPTGAAEAAVPDRKEVHLRLVKISASLKRSVSSTLAGSSGELRSIRKRPIFKGGDFLFGRFMQTWERAARELVTSPVRGFERKVQRLSRLLQSPVLRRPEFLLERKRTELDHTATNFFDAGRDSIRFWRAKLENMEMRIRALSPLSVLERGYSITFRESDGNVVRSSKEVEEGECLKIKLHEGSLRAEVKGKE